MRLLGFNCQRTDAGLQDHPKQGETDRGISGVFKIFPLFPFPVKATTRDDNQERQGGVTTRSDKKHLERFFENLDRLPFHRTQISNFDNKNGLAVVLPLENRMDRL